MNENNESLVEALAKIERQLLWARDDYKAASKSNKPNLFAISYILGGVFTAGICNGQVNGIFQNLLVNLLWPYFLGLRLDKLIEALTK